MGKIYITSDLHFEHDKSFIYLPRGFNSIEEHDKTIIRNWNSIINSYDDVYILGDLILGNTESGIKKIKQLNGNLHIIRGNHDTNNRIKEYFKIDNIKSYLGYSNILKYKKYIFYLSHYPSITSNYDEDKQLYKQIINLCGHSHCNDRFQDMEKGLIYHCELDAHNCKPILIDKIIEDIQKYKEEK